jgi:hypothetical protein
MCWPSARAAAGVTLTLRRRRHAMKTFLMAGVLSTLLFSLVAVQEPPKPGPEHDLLKKFAGDWTMVMSSGGKESKATATHKKTLGELWLSSSLEGEIAGRKYTAQRLDSYDPFKKKYVSVWVDSTTTSPTVTEGSYDEAKKTLTQVGEGLGFDGKPTKHTWVTVLKDDDTFNLTIYFGDVKEPALTVLYKRKQ